MTIWADYSGLIQKNAPASLLVISRHGLSTDGQAFIDEQADMRHQTIWELENEVFGMTDYVRSLGDAFDRDRLSQYYVAGGRGPPVGKGTPASSTTRRSRFSKMS